MKKNLALKTTIKHQRIVNTVAGLNTKKNLFKLQSARTIENHKNYDLKRTNTRVNLKELIEKKIKEIIKRKKKDDDSDQEENQKKNIHSNKETGSPVICNKVLKYIIKEDNIQMNLDQSETAGKLKTVPITKTRPESKLKQQIRQSPGLAPIRKILLKDKQPPVIAIKKGNTKNMRITNRAVEDKSNFLNPDLALDNTYSKLTNISIGECAGSDQNLIEKTKEIEYELDKDKGINLYKQLKYVGSIDSNGNFFLQSETSTTEKSHAKSKKTKFEQQEHISGQSLYCINTNEMANEERINPIYVRNYHASNDALRYSVPNFSISDSYFNES